MIIKGIEGSAAATRRISKTETILNLNPESIATRFPDITHGHVDPDR